MLTEMGFNLSVARHAWGAGNLQPWNRQLLLRCIMLLCIVPILAGCEIGKRGIRLPDFGTYRVVGYVGSRADMSKIDPTRVTHLNYAFAKIDEDGELFFNRSASEQHLAQLNTFKDINPHLKILLSVGGWGAEHFSDVALTDASRRRFANSVVVFVEDYALDGVDVDWEYPGQPGAGNKFREEDRENFTLLLEEVRRHLDILGARTGRAYLLTIATAANKRYFDHTEMDKVHPLVDFVNVMTYDMYTSGSKTTGHHAGLYQSAVGDESGKFGEAAVVLHLEAGVPPHKIVLGVPFYGRGWTGVAPVERGLFQEYERFTRAYSYRLLQEQYIDKRGFTRYWDASARAPYLWNADSTTLISYEDPVSLRYKVDYIKDHGLGGIMFWEYSLDDDGALLGTLVDALVEE